MPTIMPVSSLRTYSDVLDHVDVGAPVFLTKNGRGKYAIIDMSDYDRLTAESHLFVELEKGRESGERDGWLTPDEVRSHFASKGSDER